MSYSRKRVALACDFCRSRKRRCDARKPSCTNCTELEVACHYDDAPSQRIDSTGGSREIINRLQDIQNLLETQAGDIARISDNTSPNLTSSMHQDVAGMFGDASRRRRESFRSPISSRSTLPLRTEPWPFLSEPGAIGNDIDSSLPPLTIPVKHRTSSNYLLGLPAMKALIGEYPSDLFFVLESRSPLPQELAFDNVPTPRPNIELHRQETDRIVDIFFETAHQNHPILEYSEFRQIYDTFMQNGPDASIESALCMVVLGIGTVASASQEEFGTGTSAPGMEFVQHAMPTLINLSAWSFSYSMLLPQALVLASMYFAYIVRPLQSWRLIYSAATILQFKLSGIDAREDGAKARESLIRLFWTCFLIECDRLAELELPRSHIQQLTDETSLPNCTNLGLKQSTCYLAEISIRRLLNRIHNSLYPLKKHVLTLSSTSLSATEEFSAQDVMSMIAVGDELQSQLEMWHASIPEEFRPNLEAGSPSTQYEDREDILRIRYFAARHIIHRPFLLYITANGASQVPDTVLKKAAICIESCRVYLYLTSPILQRPSLYTWTFSLSTLGAIVVLTLASMNSNLKHLVPDIDQLQTIAIENVRAWAFNNSLEAVLSILQDIQRKQRFLQRV